MIVKLKHDVSDTEIFFTETNLRGAEKIIAFVTANGVKVNDGPLFEFKEVLIAADPAGGEDAEGTSWIRIVVGAP